MLMLGKLPVNRVRAYFDQRSQLRNFAALYFVNVHASTVSSSVIFWSSIPNGIGFLIAHISLSCVLIFPFLRLLLRVLEVVTAVFRW